MRGRSDKYHIIRFCICAATLWAGLASFALGEVVPEEGQPYELFQNYYRENVDFINRNDNRHLLPLILSKQERQAESGAAAYELNNKALQVQVQTDRFGNLIQTCVITLEVPVGMEYGGAGYQEFAISGYQSYAFLMAMYPSADLVERYSLVVDTNEGIATGQGSFTRQVGAYTLTCSRARNVAVLTFENNRISYSESQDGEESYFGEDEGEGLL